MRGRPFQPGNHLGRGRPKGSRNKKTLLSQDILESRGPTVLSQAFDLAEKGDPQMIRVLLPYLLREKESAPLTIGPLAMNDATELAQSSALVMNKVAAGDIPIADGAKLHDMLEQRRKIIETENHEKRLIGIEKLMRDRDGACC